MAGSSITNHEDVSMLTRDIRRCFLSTTFMATVAIAGAMIPSVTHAQATTGDQTTTSRTTNDDDGMDLGWLGLLGLAGLFGLRRRDDRHHTDTTTRRP
jgi:MYXO-CTERM domain-containing protein